MELAELLPLNLLEVLLLSSPFALKFIVVSLEVVVFHFFGVIVHTLIAGVRFPRILFLLLLSQGTFAFDDVLAAVLI